MDGERGERQALKALSLGTKRAMLLGALGLPEERAHASSSSSSASDRRSWLGGLTYSLIGCAVTM